jgi:hypothetical protein
VIARFVLPVHPPLLADIGSVLVGSDDGGGTDLDRPVDITGRFGADTDLLLPTGEDPDGTPHAPAISAQRKVRREYTNRVSALGQ